MCHVEAATLMLIDFSQAGSCQLTSKFILLFIFLFFLRSSLLDRVLIAVETELLVIHFQTDMDFIMDKHRLGVCLVSFQQHECDDSPFSLSRPKPKHCVVLAAAESRSELKAIAQSFVCTVSIFFSPQ